MCDILHGDLFLVFESDFSIADCALFFFEFWVNRAKWQLPVNIEAHFKRMNERTSVKNMLRMEGLS